MMNQLQRTDDEQMMNWYGRMLYLMFIEAQQEIEKIDEKQEEEYGQKQQELMKGFIKIIEVVMDNKVINEKVIIDIVLKWIKILSYSMIQSVLSHCYIRDRQIEESLIEILEKYQQLVEQNNSNENGNNNGWVYCEGVNRSDTRIVETNHPYERGKVIKFETINFDSKVSCLEIQFDGQCNSDYDNDYIILNSWYDG